MNLKIMFPLQHVENIKLCEYFCVHDQIRAFNDFTVSFTLANVSMLTPKTRIVMHVKGELRLQYAAFLR